MFCSQSPPKMKNRGKWSHFQTVQSEQMAFKGPCCHDDNHIEDEVQ